MKANPNLNDFDSVIDNLYGAEGTPQREEFRREAYAYCMGQMVCEARKSEGLSQTELAQKVGTNKTYISRIERGLIEPGIGLFCQIANALGMRVEMVRSL